MNGGYDQAFAKLYGGEEDYQAFGENIEEGMKKVLESKIKDYMGTTGLHAEAVSMLAATPTRTLVHRWSTRLCAPPTATACGQIWIL